MKRGISPSDLKTNERYEEVEEHSGEDPTGQSQGIRWDPDSQSDSDADPHKPPKNMMQAVSWGSSDEAAAMASPDLAEYLGQFDLSDFSKIAMCRTYASYLAALNRKAVRGPYKKKSKTDKPDDF